MLDPWSLSGQGSDNILTQQQVSAAQDEQKGGPSVVSRPERLDGDAANYGSSLL